MNSQQRARKLCACMLTLSGCFLLGLWPVAAMGIIAKLELQAVADVPPAAAAIFALWFSGGRMWLEAERELEAALAATKPASG